MSFDIKYPAEIVPLTFPYTRELNGATISLGSPVVSVTVVRGADPNSAQMLSGAAQISGGLVLQSIINGLPECDYHFVCQADLSDGRRLIRSGTLSVKSP